MMFIIIIIIIKLIKMTTQLSTPLLHMMLLKIIYNELVVLWFHLQNLHNLSLTVMNDLIYSKVLIYCVDHKSS